MNQATGEIMRIIRFIDELDRIRWGHSPEGSTAARLEGDLLTGLRETPHRVAVKKLLCPLEPRAIMGIGLNYRQHAAETGQPLPERPVLFMKNPASAHHPGDPIVIPAGLSEQPEVDYEVELVVVIGRAAKNVPVDRALDHVLGYTAGNDVSARRWQKQGGAGQWDRGKSFDTFCPLGPALVTADEIPDPQTLKLKTWLNGELMQDANTSDMIFTVAELVAGLSTDMTLLPGTVIMTGTPSGVGFARDPKVFLKPGDEVTVEVERIGKLTNPVRGRRDPTAA